MAKKKEKELKGFIDYPGEQFRVLESKRAPLLLLVRQAIMHAGAPDFGELIMRNAVVAQKGAEQLLFIEVAQPVADGEPDWIVFSIPLKHVANFIGKGTFYAEGAGTVRHYRAAQKYEIRLPQPKPAVFKADSISEA